MYCKSCGTKIDDDSKFCSYCGVKQTYGNHTNFEDKKISQKVEENQIHTSKSFTKSEEDTDNLQEYDLTYSKETEATFVGILLLIIMLLTIIFKPFEFDNINSYNKFRFFASITTLFFHIVITIWVVNIANRQNRNSLSWGIFAFLFPSITLIIIGLLNKIRYQINISDAQTPLENYNRLIEEADNFIKQNRLEEAELIYQYLHKNYESNDMIIFKLGEIYFNLEKFNESEKLLKLMVDSVKYSVKSNHYLGFIAMKKGNNENALKFLEISSNKNYQKSIILKKIILQTKVQKIDFEVQKKEFGLENPLNYNTINIQIETFTSIELDKKYSQTNLEIFENFLVINFYKNSFDFKKDSLIFNYKMIKSFERIIHNKYQFIFYDDNIIQFKIDNTMDVAKEHEKTINERIHYFKSFPHPKSEKIR